MTSAMPIQSQFQKIRLSATGKKTAFYRKDESAVGTFPLLDINTRTGSLFEIRYPMAGMASENVRLGVYDFSSGVTAWLDCDDFGHDQYLAGVTWSPDDSLVLVQVLDRTQKHMRLNAYDASTGSFVRTILSEDNDRFVEPQDPVWFLKGRNDLFIYRTDNRDGYKNLYLCDLEGNIRRLSKTDADVAYIGNDGRRVYYTSAEVSPIENHLFSVDIRSGKTVRLTEARGWHDITLSPDGQYFTDSYSSLMTPGVVDLCSVSGRSRANLLTAQNPISDYGFCEISLGTVKSADGKYDNLKKVAKFEGYDVAEDIKALEAKLTHNEDYDFEHWKPEIKKLLNNEIMLRYYYRRGLIRNSLNNDKTLDTALAVLNNPQEYRKMLAPQPGQAQDSKPSEKK